MVLRVGAAMTSPARPASESLSDRLSALCKEMSVTPHQVWVAAKQLIDAEYTATFSSDEEKTINVIAVMDAARTSKERNQFGNRKDPRVEGVKEARRLFGFGLREALGFVDLLISQGRAKP